ncbi:MAG: hypothetical protein U0519_04530 [Candidatus Gracilibacteria bacterium]
MKRETSQPHSKRLVSNHVPADTQIEGTLCCRVCILKKQPVHHHTFQPENNNKSSKRRRPAKHSGRQFFRSKGNIKKAKKLQRAQKPPVKKVKKQTKGTKVPALQEQSIDTSSTGQCDTIPIKESLNARMSIKMPNALRNFCEPTFILATRRCRGAVCELP